MIPAAFWDALVHALRIRYLLHDRGKLASMGERARRHAKENFLLTRHLREYCTLMIGLLTGERDRIYVGIKS